jgi:hypothetical protein
VTLDLTRRLVKGSPLTAEDHDGNLDKLENAIEGIELIPGPQGADGDGTAYYGQISRQTSGTVAVAATDTFYPINLAGVFDTANSFGMVTGTAEQLALKNDTGEPQLFTVIGTADVRSANSQVLGLRLAVQGVPIAASECRVTTGTTNYGKLLSQWIVELADGEEVSLHVANFTGTTNITVDRAKIVAFTAGRQGEQGDKGDKGDPGEPGADAPDTIDGLTDVFIIDPAQGEVLVYDGTEWVNDTAPGGSATPAGFAGEIQINDGEDPAGLGAVPGFGYDTDNDVLSVPGDINLDDGGTYKTTLQIVTPATADRTITFPDATGTVGLVAGSTGQIVFNDAGAYAGTSITFDATTGTRHVLPFGYGAGAGGTVTQGTDKATAVTLNTRCGTITMNAAALADATTVSFTLTNSQIAATDVVILNHASAGTAGAYTLNAQAAAGSASINVRNVSGGSLSEAIVLRFAVIKATTT